ncbi:MAG: AbrB/MazE/SpoVT family DNA-binding domain-containing protein [Chloroflexi bacterium]|nr:AbrB/MazE/SpoVT family DNA-binding domain-containing protein [Chloroflexota bacterium]
MSKVTRNGQLTLPADVRRKLNIEEGDYIEIDVVDDAIVLKPKKLVDSSQAYFWSVDWQDAERQVSEDIAEGRVHEFENVDDLIASLHKGRAKKV